MIMADLLPLNMNNGFHGPKFGAEQVDFIHRSLNHVDFGKTQNQHDCVSNICWQNGKQIRL